MRRGCLVFLALASACVPGAASPPPRAASVVSETGRDGPPKPRTFLERLVVLSRALDGTITHERVAEIFETSPSPTESARSFQIEIPDGGGLILVDLASPELSRVGVRFYDVPNLTLRDLIGLYGVKYEALEGMKDGPLVIFDAAQAGWPYGLYVSVRLRGKVAPAAQVRSLELHSPREISGVLEPEPEPDP